MTAPLSLRPRGKRIRRFVRASAVALSLLLGVGAAAGGALPAMADEPTPSPTATVEPEPAITLIPEAQGRYRSGSPFSATVAITNPGTVALSASRVTLEISHTALNDREEVLTWLHGDASPGNFTLLGTTATPAIDPDTQGYATTVVPSPDLDALKPGVYPIQATLMVTADDDSASTLTMARSVVIVQAGDLSPVTTLVPITATPDDYILSVNELTDLTSADGALTQQLNAVDGTRAVLAIDPAIVAAIRLHGDNAPASSQEWLARLEALPNERFALQFADADTAAQAAAGLDKPLSIQSLDAFRGTLPTETDALATPDSDDSDSVNDEPALDDLLAVPQARGAVVWPRGALSANTVQKMNTFMAEADEPATEGALPPAAGATTPVTIVPSSALATQVPPPGPRARVQNSALLVTDSEVSAAVSMAAQEPDAVQRGAHLTEATALLSFSNPQQTTLVGLDRNESRTEDALRTAIVALGGGAAQSLQQLVDAQPVSVSVRDNDDTERAEAVNSLLADEQKLRLFSSILDNPAQLNDRERIAILRLLTVGPRIVTTPFSEALAQHRQHTTDILDAVGIQPSNPILISAAVDVPVWVRNDLPYPITVILTAQPQDPRLDVQRTTKIHAEGNTTERAKVPVEARIASGEVDLVMTLASTTGVAIGSTQIAHLTVRAEWETIGLVVLAGAATLLIAAGIWRTIRRRRTQNTDPDGSSASPGVS
ncbi:DUF6049 family protein [Microbacterium sp. YY-01]|uniref:DUF6049 family protein n=1 Tax=Microbacterium sp. YY-01 TaxID=3421634 RepID=UPI003D181CF9